MTLNTIFFLLTVTDSETVTEKSFPLNILNRTILQLSLMMQFSPFFFFYKLYYFFSRRKTETSYQKNLNQIPGTTTLDLNPEPPPQWKGCNNQGTAHFAAGILANWCQTLRLALSHQLQCTEILPSLKPWQNWTGMRIKRIPFWIELLRNGDTVCFLIQELILSSKQYISASRYLI